MISDRFREKPAAAQVPVFEGCSVSRSDNFHEIGHVSRKLALSHESWHSSHKTWPCLTESWHSAARRQVLRVIEPTLLVSELALTGHRTEPLPGSEGACRIGTYPSS